MYIQSKKESQVVHVYSSFQRKSKSLKILHLLVADLIKKRDHLIKGRVKGTRLATSFLKELNKKTLQTSD